MIEIKLKIKSASVLLTEATDEIVLEIDSGTPYPKCGYPAIVSIKTAQDFGEEWCKNTFGIVPKIIDTRVNP